MLIFRILNFITSHPLSRGKRIASVKKFLFWQITVRLSSEKRVFDWVDDSRLIVRRSEAGVTGNYYVGLMEYEDMGFLLHFIGSGDTFVDVGANAGIFTILASKVVGAQSYAFEPILDTFERLKDQVYLNRINDNVITLNKGVGSESGQLNFTNDSDATNKVCSKAGANTSYVEVTTLDKELDLDRHYVIKIDVEGFELEVLKGAKNLLDSGVVKAIIIELNGNGRTFGHTDEEIDEYIRSFGLVGIGYDPKTRKVTEISGYNTNRNNTIYVRNVEATIEKCSAAPKHTIHAAFGAII